MCCAVAMIVARAAQCAAVAMLFGLLLLQTKYKGKGLLRTVEQLPNASWYYECSN